MDIGDTLAPKSDQMNADDLISGPITARIREVRMVKGDQPANIYLEGYERPWRPAKSVRRILVEIWGKNSKSYAGKAITLYRDPTVQWGGKPVGGIRVSHMSDISEQIVLPVTISRGIRNPVKIQPLQNQPDASTSPAEFDSMACEIESASQAQDGTANYSEWFQALPGVAKRLLTTKMVEDPSDFNIEKTIHEVNKGIAARADSGGA
jgi:hypothetical protein